MTFLLVAALLQEDLLARLDDDDVTAREAASEALFAMGREAVPLLERGLGDTSPEVRARCRALLVRLPEYSFRAVTSLTDFPRVRRLWNALIESVVYGRPFPRAVWIEFARQVAEYERVEEEGPHSAAWVLEQLIEYGTVAMEDVTGDVGFDDGKALDIKRCCEIRKRDLRLGAERLLAHAPDALAFEEVFAALVAVDERRTLSFDMVDEDLDLALRVLLHLRRREGAPPIPPPETKGDALKLVSGGVWIRSMAARLGRPCPVEKLKELMRIQSELSDSPLDALDAYFHTLGGLERRLQGLGPAAELPACCRGEFGASPAARELLSRLHRDGCPRQLGEGALELIRSVADLAKRSPAR